MSAFVGNSAPKKEKSPVKVYLRIRPKLSEDGAPGIVDCTPREIFMKGHLKGFTFDQIFDEKTSQEKVYKTVVGKMISDVTKGYNCTIFAYGQTGTGKTYTIIGDDILEDDLETPEWQQESKAGIILRAAMHLYEELDKLNPSIQRTVAVSFMEIYNEEIRDLLCDKEVAPLRIYEDKMKSVNVKNLQEVTVLNPMDIIRLLKRGCEKRQVASTLMNKRSSRSHTVFTISVSTMETVSMSENISNITFGKLNLIDLAGSENISKSGSKEQRAREATNINQSLLTLGRVIKALVENSPHIPYRESKLTRILQDSLGGKAKTSIIATISPGMASLEETLNTLDYAHNARNITNCPTINLRTSDTAAAVQEEIQRLRRDLFAMANEQGVYMDKENYNEMTQSLTQFKKEITTKHETIKRLTERVENLEAQQQEWEKLKESFSKTSQACQIMKSEMEKKEEELLRDGELLEYYKSESTKFKEIADLLFTRENCLYKKLDHVYQSSSKNQHVIENIIQMVTNTIDDLFLPQNSQSFSKNVFALFQFTDKVGHMIINVANQLEEKSQDKKSTSVVENETNTNYNSTMLRNLYESTEFLRSKFQVFAEKCSFKIVELHDSIQANNDYIIETKNAWQEEQDAKSQIEKLLKMDNENYKNFETKSISLVSEQKSVLSKYIEERKKAIALEKEKIQEMEEMFKSHHLQQEIREYNEKRKRIFEKISNFPNLELNVQVHQKIELITSNVVQKLKNGNSTTDEMKNCVLDMREELSKVLENILTQYESENTEMANVLEQISDILSIEGKTHIELLNESLIDAGKQLKENVENFYETTTVRISHVGDTPQPLEGTSVLARSGRRSLKRILFPESIDEERPESQ